MNKELLLQSAGSLKQPTQKAAEEFDGLRTGLAEEHNQKMARRPDLDRLIGPGNLLMMEDNTRNFCRFMSSIFKAYHPEVLVETVLWVFRAYRAHGFTTSYWPAHLDTFTEILKQRLSPETYNEIYPYMAWLITNIPIFVYISDVQLGDEIIEEPDDE